MMIKNKLFAFILFLNIFTLSINSAQAQNSTTKEIDGGEYIPEKNDANYPCISTTELNLLNTRCNANRRQLSISKRVLQANSIIPLSWPLKPKTGFTDAGYHFIGAFVDQNSSAVNIQDYNCESNTYDGHHGTDIAVYPYGFYKMENNQIEVIAAADGVIIDKHDGEFDRNCTKNSLTANYVILQHSTGACTLYWHMKNGSVTTKAIGTSVTSGEYLGVVGSSGSSSGPHLHFEVWAGNASATYVDPYSGSCNSLNANSWWINQKAHTEPAIIKAYVHSTDIVYPACPETGSLIENTNFVLPVQGLGMAPDYAKFYIFLREATAGTNVDLKIINPDGSTFSSWTYTVSAFYKTSYWGFSKKVPTIPGNYSFNATYNGLTSTHHFNVLATGTKIDNTEFKEKELFQIYPIPTKGLLTIESQGTNIGQYQLLINNTTGKEIYKTELKIDNVNFKKTIELSSLKNGTYLLSIKGYNVNFKKKIILEKE